MQGPEKAAMVAALVVQEWGKVALVLVVEEQRKAVVVVEERWLMFRAQDRAPQED